MANPTKGVDLQRRALLRGRLRRLDVAYANGNCLAHRGVYCQNCRDACEARAIAFPHRAGESVPRPVVDAAACTGCGDCLPVCPTQAMTIAGAENA